VANGHKGRTSTINQHQSTHPFNQSKDICFIDWLELNWFVDLIEKID